MATAVEATILEGEAEQRAKENIRRDICELFGGIEKA
jgi:hypothetical protein